MSKTSEALEYAKYPLEFKKYMEAESTLVKTFVKNCNCLLEVGFGVGRNIDDVAPLVNQYVGIEVDEKSLKQAHDDFTNDNVKLILLDAKDLDKKFSKNYFSKTICLFNTLSCIEFPIEALKKINFVTSNEVLITVQKKGNLKNRIKYYENFGINYTIDNSTETIISEVWGKSHSYSLDELKVLAKETGFDIVESGDLGEIAIYVVFKKKI